MAKLDPVPPGDKAAGVDYVLRQRKTSLRAQLVAAAQDESATLDGTAALLNELLEGSHLRVSREAVRRWTSFYVDDDAGAAA